MTTLVVAAPARVRALAPGRYLRLAKPGVASLCALSAAAGFCLAAPPTPRLLLPIVGIVLLAGGAGALNQYQERDLDARMARTRGRPLPAGQIEPCAALLFSLGLLSAGVVVLGSCGLTAVLLGLAGVLWYNGVYTPLKRRTVLAPLVGALVGAVPPAVGWACAGQPADGRLAGLCALLVLWQAPHVGFLLLAYAEDFAAAGLPAPVGAGSRRRLERLVFLGVLGTAAAALVPPFAPGVPARLLVAGAAAALVAAARGVSGGGKTACRRAFCATNLYLVLVLVLILLRAAAGAAR